MLESDRLVSFSPLTSTPERGAHPYYKYLAGSQLATRKQHARTETRRDKSKWEVGEVGEITNSAALHHPPSPPTAFGPMTLHLLIVAILAATSFAFLPAPSLIRSKATLCDAASDGVTSSDKGDGVISIDVSDLGLTMADLDKKIPINDFR